MKIRPIIRSPEHVPHPPPGASTQRTGIAPGLISLSVQYRSDIAALKRRVAALEQQVSRLTKTVGKVAAETPTANVKAGSRMRFTAKGLRTLRQRLGLSAADLGKLLGVTAQSVYNWEGETSRPRQEQARAIVALRGIGKKEASARIEELST